MEIRTARNELMLENLDYLPVYVYYVLYGYVYVCACDMYVNNIYIYTVQYNIYIYIYIYVLYVHGWTCDMYMVHTCLCIYLCMHVLLNAFRIIRAVARSHPLSSTPSFCCRWRPSQGDQLSESTNKNEGINPTLVRLVTGSEIDAMFLLLLSVSCRFKKSRSYGAFGKLLLFFPNQPCVSGFVLGLSWVCPF